MISRSIKLFGLAALPVAAVAMLLMSTPGRAERAASPFVHFPGNWSGEGKLTLSSGTTERIRCRASYAVDGGGASLRLQLRCASDSYKFDLSSTATYSGNEISGIWSEAGHNAAGQLTGTATGNKISIRANGQTFSAFMNLTTTASRQTISITSPGSELQAVNITLSKSR